MDSVAKEFGRLQKNGKFDRIIEDVDEMIKRLERVRNTIENVPRSRREELAILKSETKEWANKVNESQKEIHGSLSKYAKSLDKKFKVDIEGAYNQNAFPASSKRLLDRAIAMHLIREGEFEVADQLIKEANLDIPNELELEFMNMYRILHALERKDLGPAVEWAALKRDRLALTSSELEFDLHRLQFVHYFTYPDGSGTRLALDYARNNFSVFGERYLPEISKLMCAFVFQADVESSPYALTFLSPSAWTDVARAFTKEFCSLLGLSSESPLYLSAVAGSIALPTLLKVGSIMREKQTEWSSANELPVETLLPPSFQFHAIFVCPVSKEQTTDANPPMMMPCGHIVGKESLDRMSKGNANMKFKCPYCPNESMPHQAVRVYF
ncbi:CTLH/CRA C-terminal to lish motif domain-containing protein [Lipomyces arxii]|uniref:CTLH/CRA C-terminal to lish motif domain-containing protein n=1 Tax=Lipomyces arxii TaxID=56418 RepID=UPI0034CFCA48